VWWPYKSTQLKRIERIQHKLLRYINFKIKGFSLDINYGEILGMLQLDTLSHRRVKADLIFLYKLLNNRTVSPDLLGAVNLRVPSHNTRTNIVFSNNYHRTSYGHGAPIERILRNFNLFGNSLDVFNSSVTQIRNLKIVCYKECDICQ
jgi:hypothetical protein